MGVNLASYMVSLLSYLNVNLLVSYMKVKGFIFVSNSTYLKAQCLRAEMLRVFKSFPFFCTSITCPTNTENKTNEQHVLPPALLRV